MTSFYGASQHRPLKEQKLHALKDTTWQDKELGPGNMNTENVLHIFLRAEHSDYLENSGKVLIKC